MPRKKRISRTRLGYTAAHIFQLCVGWDYFSDAFGNGDDAIKKMRKAWPVLRAEVMKLWKSRGRSGLPWGCKMFDKKTNR